MLTDPTPSSSDPRDGFVEANGVRLHYLDFPATPPTPANARDTTVVMSHGTGLHAWTWLSLARSFEGRARVLAIDHRGHGDSAKNATDWSWDAMARDLAAFVAALGLERPFVVGHSMGGAVALLAEAAHPGLFRGAVLVDPIVMPAGAYQMTPTLETQPMARRTVRRREVWDSTDQALESYAARPPFASWRRKELETYVRHAFEPDPAGGGVRLKCPARIEAAIYLGGHAVDPWPLLPGIAMPTLVVQGSLADTRGAVDAPRIAATLPHGSFAEVEGATHFLPMDRPDELAALVHEFVEIGDAGTNSPA